MSTVPAAALEPINCETARTLIDNIKPGQVVVYHRGNLASDRRGRMNASLDELAAHLWQLAQNQDKDGSKRPARIDLTQVKIGSRYFYLATGRDSRLTAVR